MAMTICPIAIAVGCRKCPVFRVCPLKSVIGDQPSASEAPPGADTPTVRRKSARARRSGAKRSGGRRK